MIYWDTNQCQRMVFWMHNKVHRLHGNGFVYMSIGFSREHALSRGCELDKVHLCLE